MGFGWQELLIILVIVALIFYWWSHRVNGLHVNDFIMAAKTDTIARLAMNAESHDSPTENQVDEHAN